MNPEDAHKIECSLSTMYMVGTCVNRYALLTAYPVRPSSTSMGNVSPYCAENFFVADGSSCEMPTTWMRSRQSRSKNGSVNWQTGQLILKNTSRIGPSEVER